MQAITLWEPWATLVAIGAKRFETRSWAPPTAMRGQRIAIHAATRWTADQRKIAEEFATFPGQENLLRKLVDEWAFQKVRWQPSTLGRVLCTVRLADWWTIRRNWTWNDSVKRGPSRSLPDARHELAFGDYGYGRCVWVLQDVVLCVPPTAARGSQRFWTWDCDCGGE